MGSLSTEAKMRADAWPCVTEEGQQEREQETRSP